MVGTMASIMSSTIVNVAMPDMSRVFTLGQERAQWMSAGFMVAMTVSMLTTPWLLARFGYRRTYGGAMVLLLCRRHRRRARPQLHAGAGDARGRGAGGGRDAADPGDHHHARLPAARTGPAMGMFGMGVVLAPAIGPSIGGVLVDTVRLALDLLHGGAAVPASRWRWPTATCRPTRRAACRPTRRRVRLDGPGWARPSASCALLNGLVQLHGAGGRAVPVRHRAARPVAACCAVFVARQRRTAHPLLNLALFEHRISRWAAGGLHLRHGPVRLDLSGAGVHAARAAACRRRKPGPYCCRLASCWPSPFPSRAGSRTDCRPCAGHAPGCCCWRCRSP